MAPLTTFIVVFVDGKNLVSIRKYCDYFMALALSLVTTKSLGTTVIQRSALNLLNVSIFNLVRSGPAVSAAPHD